MGALHNPAHEIFAREVVEALLSSDPNVRRNARKVGYERAGYPGNKHNARRLANSPVVKKRIKHLFEEAIAFRDVRLATVVMRIDRVGKARLPDYFEPVLDAEGNRTGHYTLKDITALPPELSEALASIEWDDDGRPKIKLHDKNQANFTLLKNLGGLPQDDDSDKVPATTNNYNFFAGLSVEDQRTLADALDALSGGPEVIEHEAAREPSEAGAVP
jgi:hypothetical protein